jgi:cell division protease FtsH
MVTQWGFAGDTLGFTAFESADGSGPAGRQPVSEELSEKIDKEVSKLCDEAFKTTMDTLTANKALMERLTELLIEKETVDGFELNDLVLEVTGKPPATPFMRAGEEPASGNVVPSENDVPVDA